MRRGLGVALLALAPVPLAGTPAGAATVTTALPAYLNVVVDSAGEGFDVPPRYHVDRIEPVAGDTTVSPKVDCSTAFQPHAFFEVTCRPVPEPERSPLPDTVSVQGRRCVNASVKAAISGPAINEAVTGRITCGEQPASGAACTATATTPDVNNPGWFSGSCVQLAPEGPLPIRCWVDLTRVVVDSWQVTCYGTDP
jgi:hypothetical protein